MIEVDWIGDSVDREMNDGAVLQICVLYGGLRCGGINEDGLVIAIID